MISGKITKYKEPTYESYNVPSIYRGGASKYTPLEREEKLKQILKEAAEKGLVQGARVTRKYGNNNGGSICFVFDTVEGAFSNYSGECEPFKVLWDSATGNSHSFTYNINDLNLIGE